MKGLETENLDALYNAVLELKTLDECRRFFDDLCTISELRSMAQRMEVALMLRDGRVYTDIEAETGASAATISRVNRCINYGKNGYNIVIDRLKDKGEQE